ncbi:MAG TPA: energy transducer TonB [Bryobacteraceae bacterium]|nr:energy transducer TonB [Bryobacteraceae bacterium]
MFEQSLILEQGTKKPWNFLASFGVQVAMVSVALLIPLIFRDQLPALHLRDVIMGPPLSRPPEVVQPAHSNTTSTTSASTPHRVFRLDPRAPLAPVDNASANFVPDAPPAIVGPGPIGARIDNNFIPNIVALPPPPQPPTHIDAPAKPITVGGDVQMAKLLRKVIPEYPALAKTARVSGVVHLIGIISKDGTIRDLKLVSGHPLLSNAALAAVRQWVYKPTLLNGVPVEVIAPIDVTFTLSQ